MKLVTVPLSHTVPTLRSGLRVLLVGAIVAVSGCQTSMLNQAAEEIAATTHPSERDLHSGKVHFSQGNFGLAEKHFRDVVESDPHNAEGWMGLAATYDRLGRFDFADRAYDQLIRVAGRTPKIVNNMGYSHLLRGNRKKARELLYEARKGLPNDPVILANINLLEGR